MARALLFVLCLAAALSMSALASAQATFPGLDQEEGAPASPPAYDALADMLEDEASRSALVAELRRLAAQVGVGDPALAPEDVSIARQIAMATRSMAEGAIDEVAAAFARALQFDLRDVSAERIVNLAQALLDLGGVILAVVAVLYLCRLAAGRLFRRCSDWVVATRGVGGAAWVRRAVATAGCGLVDLLTVVAAWVAGYAVALLVLGDGGRMDTRQSLFLNAFLLIESAKAIVRLFFATRYEGLRIVPISAEDAAYWKAWLSRMVGFVGYGILFAVPLIGLELAPALGQIAIVLIYAVALLNAVVLVRQNRRPVQDRLTALSERSSLGFARVAYRFLGGTWHVIVIFYLSAFAIISLLRPQDALPFIVAATLQSVAAVIAGGLVAFLIARFISFGVHLPDDTRRRFPMLEGRLNAFVQPTLNAVRIAIALVVIALVLDAWAIFDFFAWVASDTGARVVGSLVTIAIILGAATVLWLVVASWVEQRLAGDTGGVRLPSARQRTLLTIFRNAFTITLVVMAAMISLSEIGLDIGPLLAGAGVLGLAIGFGAQKLVQDVITGIFIQLENAMNTGDVVSAGGTTGVVEKLTVRSVGIRDLSGTYHLIPFSSVDTVSNFMRGFGYHVGEYGVAYRESLDEVVEALRAAFGELRSIPEHSFKIIDDLEVHGLTELADSSVKVRVRIKTLPGEQWGVGRAYNALVKKHFDAAGIEIPFPHVTLYFGEDKTGKAPPAQLRLIADPGAAPAEKAKARGTTNGERASRRRPKPRPAEDRPQPVGDGERSA